MFSFENDAMLVQDKEDLIALIRMRFQSVPSQVIEKIYSIDKSDTLERLILVAANAQTFEIFLEELDEGDGAFKIIGERFNPVSGQKEDSSGQ